MVPRIQTVCGFGCGSSLMLRMNIESIAKKNGVEITAFCGDIASCLANPCDVIFTSKELAPRILDRANVPVIVLDNLMNKKEVEEKTLAYFQSISE